MCASFRLAMVLLIDQCLDASLHIWINFSNVQHFESTNVLIHNILEIIGVLKGHQITS